MKLTIFTPTYNRINELCMLYESIRLAMLKCPKQCTVEWLIVDDGSKTDIKATVERLESVNNLEIRVFRKDNGGKHTAYNLAIDKCKGDLFVCIDDDDRLTENAIKDIFHLSKEIKENQKFLMCSGFVGRVIGWDDRKLGRELRHYPIISNTVEIRDKYHFWGEPEVYFSQYLKGRHFPVFYDEKFLTEAFLFDEITSCHPLVYTNVVMMKKIFLKGGLTDNQLRIRIESPKGATCYYKKRFSLSRGFLGKEKAEINRQRFGYWAKGRKRADKITIYTVLARPVSLAMYWLDWMAYRKMRKSNL